MNLLSTMCRNAGFRRSPLLIVPICAWCVSGNPTFSQTPPQSAVPTLNYEALPNFFQLPVGENFVEPCGVAVNSKGHIYVFHRGRHPLMEFDSSGKFVRTLADDLFITAHSLRVDSEDNLWTTDVGVAFDRDGNIYVTDGEGNSRVLKFDKYGNFLLGWGMKGSGPGQFDIPHSIAVDDDVVYVGDRENRRIQLFDLSGRFLREWKLGHPFGLFITGDHFIYMCDAIAGRILKIDREGKAVGVLNGPEPGKGRHFDPHQIALDKDKSIFVAEVMPWRAQKFRLK